MLSKKDLEKFQKVHLMNVKIRVYGMAVVVMTYLLNELFNDIYMDRTTSTILTLIGVGVFIAFIMIIEKIRREGINASDKKLDEDMELIYEFDDEYIRIIGRNSIVNSDSKIKWSSLYRVLESSDCYYMYQNNSSAYIVKKDSIEALKEEELGNMIREKMDGKYKDISSGSMDERNGI